MELWRSEFTASSENLEYTLCYIGSEYRNAAYF